MAIMLNAIFSESAAPVHVAFGVSATCYRRAEYVRVIAVVVATFEFGDIHWQIFAADFVEAPHDTAFQKRPEAIDCLSMDGAINILASAMPNSAVFLQFAISGIIIRRGQAYFFRDGFADKAIQGFGVSMLDDSGHDIALALDSTNDDVLAVSAGSWRALIPMPVFIFAVMAALPHRTHAAQVHHF